MYNTKQGSQRDEETALAVSDPEVFTDGAAVLAGKDAPFGVEVLVAGTPLVPAGVNGQAVVRLKRDQSYNVRLLNRAKFDAAVRLSVDVLSMFAFSDMRFTEGPRKGEPRYDVLIIPPGKTATIKGWHRTNRESDTFKITEYSKTAAALVNRPRDIGVITATFSAAWEGKEPPAGEPDGSRGAGEDGTGFGERVGATFKTVQRNIGVVRGSVSMRYQVEKP